MHAENRFRFRNPLGLATSCALLMLTLATALAILIVVNRRAIPLGPRITPSGWTMGFRPPAGWERITRGTTGRVVAFAEPADGRRGRNLVVRAIPNPDRKSAAEIASEKRREWGFGLLDLIRGRRSTAHIEPAPFGPLEGVRLRDDEQGMVIAVGLDHREAFCVGLLNAQVPLKAADIELVKAIAGSFERSR